VAEPFRDIELPAVDLVHTDFGLHNVLFRDRALAHRRVRVGQADRVDLRVGAFIRAAVRGLSKFADPVPFEPSRVILKATVR